MTLGPTGARRRFSQLDHRPPSSFAVSSVRAAVRSLECIGLLELSATTSVLDIVHPSKPGKRRSQKQPKFHSASRSSRSPQAVLSIPSMTLYPQTQAYGQVAYAAPQGYGHQPIPPFYPPPPPPQVHYYPDATYFGRDYTARLAELTVNSRPIIQDLSMIAQEFRYRFADTVVHCLENHIRRVSTLSPFPLPLIPPTGSYAPGSGKYRRLVTSVWTRSTSCM